MKVFKYLITVNRLPLSDKKLPLCLFRSQEENHPINTMGEILRVPPTSPAVYSWQSRLSGKDPDAGKDRGQEEKGVTEDEMVGWHHEVNGHELEQTQGDGEGQGSLVCCSPRGHKESDMTEQLKENTPQYNASGYDV